MAWWWRGTRDEDLERELRSHLELEAAEQQDNGLSAEAARYSARRALGNTTLVKEDTRGSVGRSVARDSRAGYSVGGACFTQTPWRKRHGDLNVGARNRREHIDLQYCEHSATEAAAVQGCRPPGYGMELQPAERLQHRSGFAA